MTNTLKYQNYLHYKLPITINPLDYGKLIEQIGSKFIVQLNTNNILIINQLDNDNFIRLYRKGELMFEFKDSKINERTFIRTISDQKFTFENGKLIGTEIWVVQELVQIYPIYADSKAILKDSNPFFMQKRFYKNSNIIKLRNVKSMFNWEDLDYKVNNHVFSSVLFKSLLDKFWSKVENNFTESNHMFILFKIKYVTGETLSIGKLQRLNINDKDWYVQYILDYINLKSEYYNNNKIENLIFSFGFKDGKAENKTLTSFVGSYHSFGNLKIPISLNPLDFGKLINKIESGNSVTYILHNSRGETITIIEYKNFKEVTISKLGNELLKFKDQILNENNKKFVRMMNNKKFYFENGKQILFTNEVKTKFISKLKKSNSLVNKFITIDIETYIENGDLIPYLICFFDGEKLFSFYLSDYRNVDEMMLDCLNSLLKRKYNYYKIYAHNMGKFDIIFLLKYLVRVGEIKPIIHNGKFISVSLIYGDSNQYKIEFRDSILLLLYSLRSLCESFKIDLDKSIFPHLFPTRDNLNYIGDVPSFDKFIDISKKDYLNYKKSYINWSLKDESIKYCKIDCVSLYKILYKFNSIIFKLFSLNIHDYPTLSSLAFVIFRSNFMEKTNIPKLSGKIASDIRQGYTGGAVDMYIPEGSNINCYDVNSLYPSQMQSQFMPVGSPTYFKGNILEIDKNAYGFFYCNITAPDDILHPILQTKVKVNGIKKTLAPVGNWEDMLFSEELRNALNYGYKIKVLWGYTFEKEVIFKEYVEFLYNIRQNYSKSDPMNFIAKILLNSLYGRFGMNENFDNINIIEKNLCSDFENKYLDQITDKIDLGTHVLMIYKASLEKLDNYGSHNISVGIAAAITAYARIHMSQFKNNPDINLYYTDTDSIYTDSVLNDYFINEKLLGKLKLEHVCKKAIFLLPKLYCLWTNENQIIRKVKGLNPDVELNFKDFENLLFKDFKLVKSHKKWHRSLSDSKIDILNELYTLKINDNKRRLIFNKNGKLISTKSYKINKTKQSEKLINNFLVLDIETYVKEDILTPYCISIYNGYKTFSFFISDFSSVDDMVLTALKSILIRKYNRYNIYVHNLAKFDVIFLLKYLVKLGTVHPVIHNNKIITIKFNFGLDNVYTLQFKDSYLILIASLRKLCSSFKVETVKSIFPHLFVNENTLSYKGKVPNFNFFENLTNKEYLDYKSLFRIWDLKKEAVKYCEIDCISLYQILLKFNKLIFKLFSLNIHRYPTISSLAFAIFRSNFMKNNEIPQLSGKIANDIKQGYTGGAVDMYIPEGTQIYAYDVNSLYPFIMSEFDMPIGRPKYFEGNIFKQEDNPFGFFRCKIKTPDNLEHPIIQTHVKTSNGVRTIAPIGNWEDMLFSEEIKNAKNLGYNFEILWGYTFEKEIVFKNYVEILFNLRQTYASSHPMNFIAKILLNSLYGRFGMDDNFDNITILHDDFLNDFEDKFMDVITKKKKLGTIELFSILLKI